MKYHSAISEYENLCLCLSLTTCSHQIIASSNADLQYFRTNNNDNLDFDSVI